MDFFVSCLNEGPKTYLTKGNLHDEFTTLMNLGSPSEKLCDSLLWSVQMVSIDNVVYTAGANDFNDHLRVMN